MSRLLLPGALARALAKDPPTPRVPFRATVASVSSGLVTVTPVGSATAGALTLARLAGFAVAVGDEVLIEPAGTGWIVAGKIQRAVPSGYTLDAPLTVANDATIGLLITTAAGARLLQVNPTLNSIWVDSGAVLRGNKDDHATARWELDATKGHLRRGGGPPTVTLTAAAGTGAAVTVAGCDDGFRITLTTGTASTAAGKLMTVTFGATRLSSEYALALTPGDSDARAATGKVGPEYLTRSTASFEIWTDIALPASRSHIWFVTVTEAL